MELKKFSNACGRIRCIQRGLPNEACRVPKLLSIQLLRMLPYDLATDVFDSGAVGSFGILFQIGVGLVDDLVPLLLPYIDVREQQMDPRKIRIEIVGLLESGFGFFEERRFIVCGSKQQVCRRRTWIEFYGSFEGIQRLIENPAG